MITIKKDGMEITVETIEEYKIVMAAENGHSEPEVQTVFLAKQFIEVLNAFKAFPEGLDSAEVAKLISVNAGTVSSRCTDLCKRGLIIRRPGKHGYVLADMTKFKIIEK